MRKMKKVVKKMQKFMGVLVIATLLAQTLEFTSMAAGTDSLPEQQSENTEVEMLEATVIEDSNLSADISLYTMLVDCIIGVTGDSNGMHIDISTGTVGESSVLGVKDVKIYKKTSRGDWEYVAYSNGGEVKNHTTMLINILYANAVKGATYKITCVHYGNVDGYTEGSHDSGEFVFTY